MKKDDVIIISCSVCGGMSHALRKDESIMTNAQNWSGNYRMKGEFIICRICFGELN